MASTQQTLLMEGIAQVTFATWNPSDKDSNITLSNSNNTATCTTGAAYVAVRSTISKSSGKWYWEYTIGGSSINDSSVGISDGVVSLLNNPVGSSTTSCGYNNFGQVVANGTTFSGIGFFFVNDVIGIAYDATAGTISHYRNNVLKRTTTVTPGATVFAAVSMSGNTDAVTANFGAIALTYTPPSGYNAGLYQ